MSNKTQVQAKLDEILAGMKADEAKNTKPVVAALPKLTKEQVTAKLQAFLDDQVKAEDKTDNADVTPPSGDQDPAMVQARKVLAKILGEDAQPAPDMPGEGDEVDNDKVVEAVCKILADEYGVDIVDDLTDKEPAAPAATDDDTSKELDQISDVISMFITQNKGKPAVVAETIARLTAGLNAAVMVQLNPAEKKS